MTHDTSPADLADAIDDARQRLISFVEHCTDAEWNAAPLNGDPRPVGVIADHVADAYEYLTGWIRDLLDGKAVDVNAEIVDGLNATHASKAISVTRAGVAHHLRSSGDVIIALVAGLAPDQLELGDCRVARLASIAARHAESHRTEVLDALATAS